MRASMFAGAMKNWSNCKGWLISLLARLPKPKSTLLKDTVSKCQWFINVYLNVPAIMIATSCSGIEAAGSIGKENIPEQDKQADSVRVTVVLEAGEKITHTDLFLFEAGGLQRLITHTRTDYTSANILTKPIESTLVAIANCPFTFIPEEIPTYTTLEATRFRYADDNPECPLMTGTCSLSAGTQDTVIRIRPILASIVLAEVNNHSDLLIVNPRLAASGLNPEVEILRQSAFHPKEPGTDTIRASLPCDIGLYASHPGTTIHCYPNDTPDGGPGSPETSVWFECEMRDTTRLFPIPITGIPRAACIRIYLTILSKEESTAISIINYI